MTEANFNLDGLFWRVNILSTKLLQWGAKFFLPSNISL
jgi:hypothetical protein